LTPEALERLEIPRTGRSGGSRLIAGKSKRGSSSVGGGANDVDAAGAGAGEKPKDGDSSKKNAAPNREKILRRRLKFKNLYLLKLQTAGKYDPARPVKPDPER